MISGLRLSLLAGALAWSALQPAQAAPSCPALVGGLPPPLIPPAPVTDASLNLQNSLPPPALAEAAMAIIGRFESGAADPWSNVSDHDSISIGFLQWNWGSGSLTSVFMKGASDAEVALSPALAKDLAALRAYGLAPQNAALRKAAADVIETWTSSGPDDPLDRGIRRSVRKALAAWLATPAMRAFQLKLVEADLARAHGYALAWRRDTVVGGTPTAVDARLLASFFDLVVFNGGRADLWVAHVRSLRGVLTTPHDLVADASSWLDACEAVVVTGAMHTKMYNRADARKSGRYWLGLVDATPARFDNDQLDQFALGYLRAGRSVGDNAPKGFKGIYQADVMNRRGIVAFGSGYFGDSAKPIVVFGAPVLTTLSTHTGCCEAVSARPMAAPSR